MAETLKPCPFCGEEAVVCGHPDELMVYVKCSKCGAMSGCAEATEEKAAENWNRRAERTCHMSVAANGQYRCSACGHMQDDTYRGDKGWYPPEYCAHCGARVVQGR